LTELATPRQAAERRGRWKWFLALGVLLLILGVAGKTVANLLELTSVLVFGPLLLVASIMQLLIAFVAEKGKDSLLHFVAAGLEAILGFFIMANPPERLAGLVAVIAVFFVVIGPARLARALATRSRARSWAAVTGIVAVLLGISLCAGGPAVKLWLVGLCIAVDFICHGASWSALALAERKPLQAPAF
jgi:uncharacterized membrane protein HdeD (DUF308 family)